MGVSFAISAGIVMTAILYIILLMPGFVDETISLSEAASETSQLEKKILETNIEILSTTMAGGVDNFTFELKNTGSEKIWNFDKFTILITYTGTITGPLTEKLVFNSGCTGAPLPGQWCKNSIQNDLLDPGILNEDETMVIGVRLDEIIDSGIGIISVSSDLGVTASFATST